MNSSSRAAADSASGWPEMPCAELIFFMKERVGIPWIRVRRGEGNKHLKSGVSISKIPLRRMVVRALCHPQCKVLRPNLYFPAFSQVTIPSIGELGKKYADQVTAIRAEIDRKIKLLGVSADDWLRSDFYEGRVLLLPSITARFARTGDTDGQLYIRTTDRTRREKELEIAPEDFFELCAFLLGDLDLTEKIIDPGLFSPGLAVLVLGSERDPESVWSAEEPDVEDNAGPVVEGKGHEDGEPVVATATVNGNDVNGAPVSLEPPPAALPGAKADSPTLPSGDARVTTVAPPVATQHTTISAVVSGVEGEALGLIRALLDCLSRVTPTEANRAFVDLLLSCPAILRSIVTRMEGAVQAVPVQSTAEVEAMRRELASRAEELSTRLRDLAAKEAEQLVGETALQTGKRELTDRAQRLAEREQTLAVQLGALVTGLSGADQAAATVLKTLRTAWNGQGSSQ